MPSWPAATVCKEGGLEEPIPKLPGSSDTVSINRNMTWPYSKRHCKCLTVIPNWYVHIEHPGQIPVDKYDVYIRQY